MNCQHRDLVTSIDLTNEVPNNPTLDADLQLPRESEIAEALANDVRSC